MRIRTYRLDAIRELILKTARFRRPQKAAFDAMFELVRDLDDDLCRVAPQRLLEQLREARLNVPHLPANLIFELATGVGKTRLMGAIISFLYRAGQSSNAVILSSRSAIVEKLERESQTNSPKYLFLDPAVVPEPNLCFRSTLGSFRPLPDQLNVFILSPQTITGGDRRFAKGSDFGSSMLDYLRGLPDLVVYVDESHHLQGEVDDEMKAWQGAVNNLQPRLQFGFTATSLPEANANVLYRYTLANCLRDAQYTKAVKLWVEQVQERVTEHEWDHVTLDFALQRLNRKRAALRAFAERDSTFEFVEPVMLVAARDTEHAEQVAAWLKERRDLKPEELHVAHSHRRPSEEELQKLVAIDRPGNRIRVVVNVFQLTEGWDVTNVYVVAPLRAMATYQNAVQSMGRGLRLPFGRRVGDPELDTLDVLCFGRETFERIVEQATKQFSDESLGVNGLTVSTPDHDEDERTKRVRIAARMAVSFQLPTVERIPPEPVLDFEISKTPIMQVVSGIDMVSLDRISADDDALRYDLTVVVRNATLRVLDELSYLSLVEHRRAVEKLVSDLLTRLGAKESDEVAIDPYKVAALVSEEIQRRYVAQPVRFQLGADTRTVAPAEFEWLVRDDYSEPVARSVVKDWQ
jgi:superfamily II DNA or RNA helicase